MSQAAERVLDVLDTIALADSPLAVMEVASLTGLNKSTCSRLLKLLESRELIVREPDTKRYRIGPTSLGLSATMSKRTELLRIVHPYLEAIRNDSHETTSFHLRVGDERLCIDAVDRFPPQLLIQPLGIRRPLYVGTSGRVIAAHTNDTELERIIRQAEASGQETSELEQAIGQAKDMGYLAGISYLTKKHVTLSAPLFQNRLVFGAVTITGPLDRWDQNAAEEYASTLMDQAELISATITNGRIFVYQ